MRWEEQEGTGVGGEPQRLVEDLLFPITTIIIVSYYLSLLQLHHDSTTASFGKMILAFSAC